MKAKALLEAFKHKLDVTTDRQLTEALGITQQTLIGWRKNDKILNANQLASLLKKAINRGKEDARQHSIKPIVEYYPIKATPSKQGAKWEIIKTSQPREQKIKAILAKEHGIYVFYNSQCNAIYVGKAKQRNLWGEIKSAFNRDRDPQVLWRVSHPTTGDTFLMASEKPRRIRRMKVYLHDIAHYFSAYSVEKALIDNAEAFLIRVFANDLTNEQIEKIKIDKKALIRCHGVSQ
jgi:hypothetical protein